MLRVNPKCSFDLSGIPTDFVVKVVGRSFPTYRFLLMTQSDFFRKLLTSGMKETGVNEFTYSSGDASTFKLVMKTIHGEAFKISDLYKALGYMTFISYFQVKQVDLEKLHQDLVIPPEKFMDYITVLNTLYPEGFTQETVDIIASKIRLGTDLKGLSPELEKAIIQSERYPFTNGENDTFTDKLLQIIQEGRDLPEKTYVSTEQCQVYIGKTLAEVYLKIRENEYRTNLNFIRPLIHDLPGYTPMNLTPITSEHRLTKVPEFMKVEVGIHGYVYTPSPTMSLGEFRKDCDLFNWIIKETDEMSLDELKEFLELPETMNDFYCLTESR